MDFFRRSEDKDYLTNMKVLICIAMALMVITGDQGVDAFPTWRPQLENVAPSTLLVFDVRSAMQQLVRKKRYTLTPHKLKWDHFNLTYKILSFPKTLNEKDTEKGIAEAFQMWSEISPFNFTEVPANASADIKIVVWLTDLVHIAAHEIGHSLGLMHSLNTNAIMHKNATLTRKDKITQDDIWGIWRLYGCLDRLDECPSWAHEGFCEKHRTIMKKHCPLSCDFCRDPPIPTNAPTAVPPRTKVRQVHKGRNITVQCGQKIAHKKGILQWYKDGELLEISYPGYISMKGNKLSIIANAINEGTYTCLVKKKGKILTKYSWQVVLRVK
ncbi:matrix metalloproteinase-23 isoform X2 [Scyliorhinus torazame]|uniref:matrix metalloproteinase-23 isoform X2 n=1 Tax=Scyliorhinus torazame TaxID=75743 RepID=UPI003B5C27ED